VARRGFSNYPFKRVAQPVNLFQLEGAFADGETVSLDSLREKNVIGRRVDYVKILANGEVTKKLIVQGLKVSNSAAQKIVAAGGSVEGFEAATEATTATEQAGDAQAEKASAKSKSKSGSKKATEAEKKDEPAAEEGSSDAKASAESSDAEETTEEQDS
jgi:ribosomal protein L18E